MANNDDRVLVLKGAGDDFSSGADMSGGLGTGHPRSQDEGPMLLIEMRAVGEIVNRLHPIPKPCLAVVDGVLSRRLA